MSAVTATIEFKLTPAELAAAYWAMDSDDQAEFFASLEDAAGYKLCMQTAWVVRAMVERANKGDHRAWLAFRTMFEHAHEYHADALDIRCDAAKRGKA